MNVKIQRLKAGKTLELHDLLKLWIETFEAWQDYFKTNNQLPFLYCQEFPHLQSNDQKHLVL